jgi:hypothetical protein
VFGSSLASALGCKAGGVMGSARVYPVASLDELQVSPPARRELWQTVVSPVAH